MIFFDSHGGAWVIVPTSAAGAEPFGPCGSARRLTADEHGYLGLDDDAETPAAVAANNQALCCVPDGAGGWWDVLSVEWLISTGRVEALSLLEHAKAEEQR
jgi:hypothetical protein